jgi:anthranilate/para-aminobenzoate synthase component I
MFHVAQLLSTSNASLFLIHKDCFAPAMIVTTVGKIPFLAAPEDDRHLPDMHLALYNDVVVFDQATKLIYIISWVHLDADAQAAAQAAASSSNGSSGSQDSEVLRAAYDEGKQRLRHLVQRLSSPPPSLPPAQVSQTCSKLVLVNCLVKLTAYHMQRH